MNEQEIKDAVTTANSVLILTDDGSNVASDLARAVKSLAEVAEGLEYSLSDEEASHSETLGMFRRAQDDRDRLKAEVKLHRQKADAEYWCWQGDGSDYLESLVCPVLIPAKELAKIVTEVEELKQALKNLVGSAKYLMPEKVMQSNIWWCAELGQDLDDAEELLGLATPAASDKGARNE